MKIKKSKKILKNTKDKFGLAYIKTYYKAIVIKSQKLVQWGEKYSEGTKPRGRSKKLSRPRYLTYNKGISWHYYAMGQGRGWFFFQKLIL